MGGVAVGNGVVYFVSSRSGIMYALEAETGAPLATVDVGALPSGRVPVIDSPSIVDGTVYLGVGDLLAFVNTNPTPGAIVALGLPDSGGVEEPPASPTNGETVVDSRFTDPGQLTGMRGASCGVAQPGVCEFSFTGHSTVTGSLSGWTDYAMWGHGNTDGSMSYSTRETFTGTVSGCGRGTFDFVSEGGRIEPGPSSEDPSGQRVHAPWTLVPGSGTGDLVGLVSGSGVLEGVAYPDTSTRGRWTGVLRCRS
jgi:hypothetical protein